MKTTPDSLRTRLRDLISEKKIDASTLSKDIGRSKDYIRDFIEGRKQSLSFQSLKEIEVVLNAPGSLISETMPPNVGNFKSERAPTYIKEENRTKIPILPVQQSAIEVGRIAISRHVTEFQDIPPPLSTVMSAYGLICDTDCMFPIYEPGDVIFVNPALGMRRGTDVIVLTDEIYADAAARQWRSGYFGRLKDFSAEFLEIETENPKKTIKLDREYWPQTHRVVIRYHKR